MMSEALPLRGAALAAVLLLGVSISCGDKSTPTTPTPPTSPSTPAPAPSPVPSAAVATVNVVLGRPSDVGMSISVLAENGSQVYAEYGTTPGVYSGNTTTGTASGGYPVVLEVERLQPNTRYYYRVRVRTPTESAFRAEPEYSFSTQRAAGSSFTFGVQGDSHPERTNNMFNAELYNVNMRNAAAGRPDFYIALGDDFSSDGLIDRGQWSQSAVEQLYAAQRAWFGLVGNSSAVFLVNGNHEQAAGYLLNGRFPSRYADAPVFQLRARTAFFALPAPDRFYTGDEAVLSGVGPLRDYYAWTWGDALFVTIDPYWHSPVPVDNGVADVERSREPWDATIGDVQYEWLRRTLESSRARFKFVFEHHVLGSGRGAAGLVHTYEWGGYNRNGSTFEFRTRRPAWSKPIHQLFTDTGVTAFFFAHDHLFAREQVDSVIYQSVPNPADNTYTAFNAEAYLPARVSLPGARYTPSDGVVLPNAGHLRVTVSPSQATVAYVRAVLPGDESKAGAANNAVSYSYTIPAPALNAATAGEP